ncbi:MAG: hypothetical protein ABFS34_13815 [Gemmatimonadota bacterium]
MEPDRVGPIPVRELMGHLSGDEREPGSDPADVGGEEDIVFSDGATTWIARETGEAAWGADVEGIPAATAIHFFRRDAPRRALREALLPRGRLPHLFPAELRDLLAASAEVPPEGTVIPARRARGGRNRRGRSGASGSRSGAPGNKSFRRAGSRGSGTPRNGGEGNDEK